MKTVLLLSALTALACAALFGVGPAIVATAFVFMVGLIVRAFAVTW